MEEMRTEHADMTRGSLLAHLRHLALPASTGLLFNTLYNITDSFWAGRLSTDALAALSLNFPLYMLNMSLGVGFSAAAGALIANALGAGKQKEARTFLSRSLSLSLLFSLTAMLLLLIFLTPLFRLLNAEGRVLSGAVSYGRIIVLGMPLINLAPVLSSALASRGDTKSYRNILMAGFVLNIAMDPLFMYALGMEEGGVALATVLIQAIGILYLLKKVLRTGGLRGIVLKDYIPHIKPTREILEQAVPATANFLTMSLGTFVITWFASKFGRDAVAAYGAAVRVEQIALVPTAGLNVALAAIVGQNNGARRMDRIIKAYRLSLLSGLVVMGVILPPVLIFGRQIIGLFTQTREVIGMGYNYLLLQGITFYSYILLFQSNALLQGLKKPGMIMWMGLYRQIAAPALVFSLFCFVMGMEERGVWLGLIPINWSAALMTLYRAIRLFRQRCRNGECEEAEPA